MKTPEQIRDMEFQKSPMGGYKQSDVELFLEEVASQIEILMKQKNDAERKLQEVSRKAPEAALTASGIQNVLVSAQRVADQVVEDAKIQAEGITADAQLKLTEADIKSKEIIAGAEQKAIMLGETAEAEAAKIIAAAVKESEIIIAEAKESVELEQKLYDRMKIEISDFRKKASQQCSALVELINQLPGEIPFNIERSKTVLSVDFSDPELLLKNAVDERIAKEHAAAEELAKTEVKETVAVEEVKAPEVVPEPAPAPVQPAEPVVVKEEPEVKVPQITIMPEAEAVVTADTEFSEDVQLAFDAKTAGFEITEEDEENIPLTAVVEEEKQEVVKPKTHISFGDDDDDDDDFDDDDDDEPRLFFRRKKK